MKILGDHNDYAEILVAPFCFTFPDDRKTIGVNDGVG
jgi:hypothetical protein